MTAQGTQRPDRCGCCEGTERLTPASVENAPGLSALLYRVGTHARFRNSMQAELSRRPALGRLTTRSDDDASIALLDAGAAMLDVLTFYQERIVNEGYLRTAAERRSLLELARAIGHELRPGVAAEAHIAFTVEEAPGSPPVITIDEGAKVQSVPGPGEKPQTFETVEEIEARAEWNAIRPLLSQAPAVSNSTTELHLEGAVTGLRSGDSVLLVLLPERTTMHLERVVKVLPDTDNARTRITLQESASLNGQVEVYALREKVGIFGNNAPYYYSLPATLQTAFPNPWDSNTGIPAWSVWDDNLSTSLNSPADIYLDREVSGLSRGDYVVLEQHDFRKYYRIGWVNDESRTGFALSAKVTGLVLRRPDAPSDVLTSNDKPSQLRVRDTNVYTGSELLELARTPVTDHLAAGQAELRLDEVVPGLRPGQPVAIRGETPAGDSVAEVRTIAQITEDDTTVLELDEGLEHAYLRHTVAINANVAAATHGETRREVLGSGDASQAFQSFVLKQIPLTYVQSATESGGRSTLEVRVNDILWHEVPTLYGRGPRERVYATRMRDDGRVTVLFGDGRTGARLPTGAENVKAVYRVGTGADGNVGTGQLSTLLTRPLGLRAATNMLAAEGGADPESRDRARQNAPLTVRTLGRVVSLLDYEDFARGFSGVGKAQAIWLWNGEARVVHLTIAGDGGELLSATSNVLTNLRAALDERRDPLTQLRIDSYEPVAFTIEAKVWIDPDHESDNVLPDVRAALHEAFAFEARAFAQAVTRAEVLAVMQRVAGVRGVDLEALRTDPQAVDPNPTRLTAASARWNPQTATIEKAELLLLDHAEAAVDLTEVQV